MIPPETQEVTITRPELRSNHPVGSPRWATTRTQWKSMGYTDEQIRRPKIAVVNSSSGLAPCFSHLDAIATAVWDSIDAAGGLAFEIRTVAPTDFIMAAGRGGGYVLSGRDLVSYDIEAVVDGAQLDGMVCLASCDKTTPGQLMAAARTDVPTLVIACGYHSCGALESGRRVDIEDVFVDAGKLASGAISFEDLCAASDRAITSPGVCTGMGTANTMHIVAEALGMALPGTAPTRANSDTMWAAVRASGAAIMAAVEADRRPSTVMTRGAVRNAVAAVIAVSGSINAVKHLEAIAAELPGDLDVHGLFEELGRHVGPLAAVRPNGPSSIEEFDDAGGARAVLAQLGDVVDGSVVTVNGRTMAENLAGVVVDPAVIRAEPIRPESTIVVMRGSLCPGTGIVKLSVTETRARAFRGPARVYESAPAATAAIESGGVQPGEVLVLRGLGVTGTPGMGMASSVVFALNGAGLSEQVAFVTDGQLSGLVNKGIVVGEVTPEGGVPGPLGVVRTGDEIAIDVPARTVELLVDPAELDRRLAEYPATRPPQTWPARRGSWLGVYAGAVEPLDKGATLRRSSTSS
ncbi:dihydroxy-acid dehydratase [Amycolatopsis sp. FDAARGOS 1241]|uniref:dihydroxy-acid dehydratase domain-containing protein n=1 Tax=Amycolatopsis sp. FDAARGOS 1241 TaxID=2778070 RepID=UPI00195219B5|nr:dihydroxy-acid dehydratase [Amycolatopsis sp. FDAARGOS 1241]QRP43708.1 dihydroxy-acid dehydratase [Amycolatopsis sp. FDAARGOS 1241]